LIVGQNAKSWLERTAVGLTYVLLLQQAAFGEDSCLLPSLAE